MKTIVLLVALGWMLTFLHVSWVEENACRAKSTSVGEKSDGIGDAHAVTVISTDAGTARLLKVAESVWGDSSHLGTFREYENVQTRDGPWLNTENQ